MAAGRSRLKRGLLTALLLIAGLGFSALGVWQVERRTWKLHLLADVDRRVHASPVAAPGPTMWANVAAGSDAYRHVRIRGVFLHDRETFVQALTERGAGFWVMTPLKTDAGWIVLINRGFVPPERRPIASRRDMTLPGEQTISGLLRISEPKGGFLRRNDPAADRWYSRDVAAIARDRRLDRVAPYFIDAEAGPDRAAFPVGGLTVIAFPNNHLVYALTWFALAVMSLLGLIVLLRRDRDAVPDA